MKKLIIFGILGVISCTQLEGECNKVNLGKSETSWFGFIKNNHQIVYKDQDSIEIVFEKIKSRKGYTSCNTFELGPNQFENIAVQQKLLIGSVSDRNKKYDIQQMAGEDKNQIDLYFFDFWVNFTLDELSKSDTQMFKIGRRDYLGYRLESRKGSRIDSLYWSLDVGVIAFKYGGSHFTLQ